MALISAVVVRTLHLISSTHGAELDWHSFVGTFVALPIVLLAIATVHLSNYPVPQWLWRAPAFALLESVFESLASLGLIYAGRERWGTGRAEPGDWPAMAGMILLTRIGMVCLFALILGGVTQFVRRRELRAERKHGGDRLQQ